MNDKYDEAIAVLTADPRPENITGAWSCPWLHEAGCLFKMVSDRCGCLTQVRNTPYEYNQNIDPKLNAIIEEIAADERIPKISHEITIESLPVFAEWQRRLDREFPNRHKS